MTRMCIGEAAALLWLDIDFDTGLLSITKTMYYKSMDDFKPVKPKTQASVHTIYIDTDTLKELQVCSSAKGTERLQSGDELQQYSDQ